MSKLTTTAKKMNAICTDRALPGRFCIATTRLSGGLGLALEMHPDKDRWRLTLSRSDRIPSAEEISVCREAFNVPQKITTSLTHGQVVIQTTGEVHNIVRLQWSAKEQPSLLKEKS